jgi:1-acyl-sn-glycerol-3-phosphate acyltransferase
MPILSKWLWVLPIVVLLLVIAVWTWRRSMRRCEAAHVADWGHPWLNRLDGLNRILCHRFHRLRPVHCPLPRHGPALVVANHVSGLDPLLMIAATRRPLRFLIAREQYERFGLRWLFRAIGCIPVDRGGSPHRALAAARHALQQGEVVALFPHGRIHLDHEPAARIKPGILHLARMSGAPVHPMRIDGVRGVGQTLAAVFRRSRARITVLPPLSYDDADPDRLLEALGRLLGRHSHPAD